MNRRSGFTLIEIIIALGVFMIGFVGVMGLFAGGYRTQEHASSRITETLIAESLFDTLREPEVGALKNNFTGVTSLQKEAPVESDYHKGYYYTYTYEPLSAGNTRKLFVTVYVFQARFLDLYSQDYATLDAEQKAEYDKNCLKLHTIIDMENN